ncbi:MAG: hypothetical protein JG782_1349 [Anaerophaga sp.]|jgi:hypothetical protein|nr:hypothetical protein [Anaerophaga sp.]MDK2841862.1 hypothetical protein [Anaerophaga sp.]
MKQKLKDRKTLVALLVLVVSILFFSFWFSNWNAFEQFLKALFNK